MRPARSATPPASDLAFAVAAARKSRLIARIRATRGVPSRRDTLAQDAASYLVGWTIEESDATHPDHTNHTTVTL
jgi:hypothetical protein